MFRSRLTSFFSVFAVLLFAVGTVWANGIQSGDNSKKSLTIIVKVPVGTQESDKVFVTGNADVLCQWRPSCIEMRPIGYDVYQADVEFPATTETVEFKITRGTWATEASGPSGVFQNIESRLTQATNREIVNISSWNDRPLGVTGRVDLFSRFYSPQLRNYRMLRIWLPPDYGTAPAKSYPVIYLHDGQNMFDPGTSFAGVDWSLDETMTTLISQGKVGGAILVGLDSTDDRDAEYDITLRGNLYARFLIDTVKPWIDLHYRTLPDRMNTFTMGSSMGAVISFELVWKYFDVFSKAGAVSFPADANGLPHQFLSSSPVPTLPVSIYMDHGDFGYDAHYAAPAKALVAELARVGFPASQLDYRQFPYADHTEADWARRAEVPLLMMLKK